MPLFSLSEASPLLLQNTVFELEDEGRVGWGEGPLHSHTQEAIIKNAVYQRSLTLSEVLHPNKNLHTLIKSLNITKIMIMIIRKNISSKFKSLFGYK